MSTTTKMPHCRASTKAGSPCRACPAPGKSFCTFHDPRPAAAAAQATARQEGGRRRSLPRAALPTDLPDITVAGVRDIGPLLSETINQVRKGLLDPRIANTVGYLASVLIRAFEVGDLENRIALLESATQHSSPTPTNAFNHQIGPHKEHAHVHQVQA